MGAVVSDWAPVGAWAVVKNSQEIPAEHIAVGVSAQVLEKRVDADHKRQWTELKATYAGFARRYPRGAFAARP